MDHPLVEWCASLPSSLKMRGGEQKYLLKKAMEPHLSHETLYRQKMGFAVPVERWFRGPLRQRVRNDLLNGALAQTGYFDQAVLRQMIEDHQDRGRDFTGPLWAALMLEAFLRNVEGYRTDAPAIAQKCA